MDPAREVRKIVTVVFCDQVGSTHAAEGRDPEVVRRVQLRYFDEARAALERHGGTVEKFIGDAVMAVFGVPTAREDDAIRALRSAIDLRDAVERLGLTVRIGVNSGEVVAGTGDALVTGDTVNTASRLEHVAPPGEILVGTETLRLAGPAVEAEAVAPIAVKGKADPVAASRLLRVHDEVTAASKPVMATSPFVGRGGELATLEEAFATAVRERVCRLVAIVGAPGIGKSRLAGELADRVRADATVLVGRCPSYGEGITYRPLGEIFRGAGAEEELGRALAEPTREETSRAIRAAFARWATEQPLVVILEDLHWAEPTFLDLVEQLVTLGEGPILVLGPARPELLDARPAWDGDLAGAGVLRVEGLPPSASEALIAGRAGSLAALGDEVGRRIVERAEGNPLFLEELAAMAAEDGDGSSRLDAMPTTIQSVLVARLERLHPAAARVAGLGSVEGLAFHRAGVLALAEPELRPEISSHLDSLVASQLVRGIAAADRSEDFAFRHQLIRDAAYGRLAKADRAELHEGFATWLERTGSPDGGSDEVLGYHLERSALLRTELDPGDPAIGLLAGRGADRLTAAGVRAFDRSDMAAAANLLGRAERLMPPGDARLRGLLADLGSALAAVGDLERADEVLDRAVEEARAAGDVVAEGHAVIEHLQLRLLNDPTVGAPEARREAERWIEALGDSGEDRVLAKAWFLLGTTGLYACRYAEMEEAMRRAAEYAERAGDRQQRAAAVQWLSVAIRGGPRPVQEGITAVRDLLARAPAGSEAEAGLLVNVGVLHALAGSIDEARDEIQRGRALFRDLGMGVVWAVYAMEYAEAEHTAGEAERALPALREACASLQAIGEQDYLSTVTAYLGRVLADLGEDDEAFDWSVTSQELAGPDDLPSQVLWRCVRARVLARRGEHAQAERLAREALALTETSDDATFTGTTLLDLGEVLALAGETAEARSCVERALPLFERKGAVPLAERARARLAALA